MDFDVRPYDLSAGLQSWSLLVAILLAVAIGLAFVLSLARNGGSGVVIFMKGLASYLSDLATLSPRRIFALTMLTLKEAVRRKALLIFVVFSIFLMFGGWFITNSNDRAELQVSVHVTFILTAIAWLILPAVIFLSCWALPEDIRIRSMHTVVTKPVRRVEVVIGRMLGMGIVTGLVLVLMGFAGYIWLVRQIPESAKDQLTCRVPSFGELYFINPDGQPARQGINVGDVWTYRSHIQGNSRARAVWLFPNVDETSLVTGGPEDPAGSLQPLPAESEDQNEWLKLECRFEAFRTIKGSEKSIKEGVQAQYVVAANYREDAFGMLSQSEQLRPVADALRDGQFRTGAKLLRDLTEQIRTSPEELRMEDYFGLRMGFETAAIVLEINPNAQVRAVAQQCMKSAEAAFAVVANLREGSSTPAPYEECAAALEVVAESLEKDADILHENLPRIEIPLPSFSISEYHEGAEENVKWVPRKLRFAADFETLARFLATSFDQWDTDGKLVDGSALKSDLAAMFVAEAAMSEANAAMLMTVIQEQLAAGSLKIESGRLSVADGRRWFSFFDDLIRRELLISQENEGWVLEKDLLTDLTVNKNLRIEVACLNDQMYLGMARPDLFVRKADRNFVIGYSKALFNIGLMQLLIIVLGVTVSCVVKGPVALFFTLTFFLVGQFFHKFMLHLLSGREEGLGTFESAVLIAQHRNPQVGMNLSETTQGVVKAADQGLFGILRVFSNIVPDFSVFSSGSAFVENGFDVPFRESVVPAIAIFFGFMIPCILMAGAMLKFRELEAK